MQVREAMTENPYCLSPEDSVQWASQEMKRHNVGVMPVCSQEELVGVITDRDIATEFVAAGESLDEPVSRFMTANAVSISPDASLKEALSLMGSAQVRRLCVTHNNRLVGVLSLGDLAVSMEGDGRIAGALAAISQPVRGGGAPEGRVPATSNAARPASEKPPWDITEVDPIADEAGRGRPPQEPPSGLETTPP